MAVQGLGLAAELARDNGAGRLTRPAPPWQPSEEDRRMTSLSPADPFTPPHWGVQ